MPFTTRGEALMLAWSFRNAARPAKFYLRLVTNAITPTHATKTASQLDSVAGGNGYSAGGYELNPGTTDFPTLVENDTDQRTEFAVKNISISAVGGNIPSSGGFPNYLILTTDEADIGSRQVIWYQSLGAEQPVFEGLTLTITGIQTRMHGGSVIKNIQRGTITMTGTNASGTATITSVNTLKAELAPLGFYSENAADNDITDLTPRLRFLNATTVQAVRGHATALNGTLTVEFQVTEYF